MHALRMADLDLAGKRVLVREDLNCPIKNGQVTNDARLRAALPTLQALMAKNARTIVVSHLGRPKEGVFDPALSLRPVAERLGALLGFAVPLVSDWRQGVQVGEGQLVLLENIRFTPGEGADDEALGRALAGLCDVFVMDAFATAHRAQASTHAVARFAPIACAGPLLVQELDALERIVVAPQRPVAAVTGGAKLSTKLGLIERLLEQMDLLIPGGGIANTFLGALGYPLGQSLTEPAFYDQARALHARHGGRMLLPEDVVVAAGTEGAITVRLIDEVHDDERIMDIGPHSQARYAAALKGMQTIVWNGPMGAFEDEAFATGTRAMAQAIASSGAFSVVGGGETIEAVERFGLAEQFSYLSTAGGAFLEYLEGRTLPGVAVLEERAAP